MKNIKKEKNKQLRKTRYDSLSAQKRMRKIVKQKIIDGTCLTTNELDVWEDTIADALMTWGKIMKVYYNFPNSNICFGSIHTFALKLMDYNQKVTIKDKDKEYTFEIKDLWKLLYKYMLEVFPLVLDEALHISSEDYERESTDGYLFSAKSEMGVSHG